MFIDIEIHVGFLVVLSKRKYVSIMASVIVIGLYMAKLQASVLLALSRYSLSLHPKHQSSHLRKAPLLVLCVARIDLIQKSHQPSTSSPSPFRPQPRSPSTSPGCAETATSILHHVVLARRHAAELASDQQRPGTGRKSSTIVLAAFICRGRGNRWKKDPAHTTSIWPFTLCSIPSSSWLSARISVAKSVLRSVSRSPNRSYPRSRNLSSTSTPYSCCKETPSATSWRNSWPRHQPASRKVPCRGAVRRARTSG
jgi:hypothetical protein